MPRLTAAATGVVTQSALSAARCTYLIRRPRLRSSTPSEAIASAAPPGPRGAVILGALPGDTQTE